MSDDIYKKLARHLDDLPGGFPSTDTGVELRILRRLFDPGEARMAVLLTLIPEEARVIARRAGMSREETEEKLKTMAEIGLIFSIDFGGRPGRYMAAQYVIGIWEYHVNDLDPELIRDMNEYIPTLFDTEVWRKSPQLRTIPVKRSLTPELSVLSYEKAEELIENRNNFLVAPCICRREHRMIEEGCDKPEESCLVIGGAGVAYYQRAGMGRVIDKQEVIEILKRADKAGLVLQPSNAQKIVNICCCCGCCCQVLKSIKRQPRPAELVSAPFIAAAEPSECKGCGVCVDRCQMEALSMEDEVVVLDADRCIGCGLCVSTCPTDALSLVRKPGSRQPVVPEDMVKATIRLARERGKLGAVEMAKMQLKSKLDRLLAAR
ncbi:MAG: 4Fe-4S dicluster domain-containing protein [Desulfobacterales bacterium]|nr:4Fe-4S dicluster domain-containing protein [Desulfobacterales bacterium]